MGWSYFLYFASQEEEKAVEEKELEDWQRGEKIFRWERRRKESKAGGRRSQIGMNTQEGTVEEEKKVTINQI